jgi:hypothetical protein
LSLQEQRDLVRALIKQVLITPGRGCQRVDVQEMPDSRSNRDPMMYTTSSTALMGVDRTEGPGLT